MRRRRLVVGVSVTALVLLAMCCVAGVVLVRGHVLARLYNDLVLDNRDHFLPCERLPTSADVHRIMEEHQDTLQAIEGVNPGFVWVEVDETSCPGKADLLIYYASHQNRLAIEKIIGGETFFGVPYRLRNV